MLVEQNTPNFEKAMETQTAVGAYCVKPGASASSTTRQPNDQSASTSTSQPAISQTMTSSDVLSSEVVWSLKCMDSHYSYHSCANSGDVFRKMFPDSNIASKFTLGETKAAYLITFGIAPYFKSLLVREISR